MNDCLVSLCSQKSATGRLNGSLQDLEGIDEIDTKLAVSVSQLYGVGCRLDEAKALIALNNIGGLNAPLLSLCSQRCGSGHMAQVSRSYEKDGVSEIAFVTYVSRLYGVGCVAHGSTSDKLPLLRQLIDLAANELDEDMRKAVIRIHEEETSKLKSAVLQKEQIRAKTCVALWNAEKEGDSLQEETVNMLIECADANDTLAMSSLAERLEKGKGMKQDVKKALELFQRASQIGDADSMKGLGMLYLNGEILPRDQKKAIELLKHASDLGCTSASFNLGVCYDKGEGTEPDKERAFELYRRASHVSTDAQFNLSLFYQNGEVSPDKKKAFELLHQASELGDSHAMVNLADCYLNGEGVTQDANKAIELYERASDLGNSTALVNLGVCFENGIGVTHDEKKAVLFYQHAADMGDAEAIKCLGVCYEFGKGVKEDKKKAVELYQQSSEMGNANAMKCLGVCYENGSGVAKQKKKATR